MGKTPYISLLLRLPPLTCWGTLMIKESRGEDKRVTHLQATLEGHIKIRYYEMACCRVSLARVDTEMYYRRQSLWCGSRKGGTTSPWCISSTLKDIQYHTHGTLQWTGRVAMVQCQKSYQPDFFPLLKIMNVIFRWFGLLRGKRMRKADMRKKNTKRDCCFFTFWFIIKNITLYKKETEILNEPLADLSRFLAFSLTCDLCELKRVLHWRWVSIDTVLSMRENEAVIYEIGTFWQQKKDETAF